jgi:hypothetical protein
MNGNAGTRPARDLAFIGAWAHSKGAGTERGRRASPGLRHSQQ